MRADANKIGLSVIRSILDGAKPGSIEVDAAKVTYAVSRGPTEAWPQSSLSRLEESVDGPWPRSVGVTCEWEGGRTRLRAEAVFAPMKKYRDQPGLRLRLEEGHRRTLVWVTVPPAIGDRPDGEVVRLRVAVSTFQRKLDVAPDLSERVNAALRNVFLASGLPVISTSSGELCQFELPSGTIVGGAELAFQRLLHLALLKLDFVDRGPQAKDRGKPLFDLGQFGIDASDTRGTAEEDHQDDEGDDGESGEAEQRGRRYWAGGFGKPERLREFISGSFWQIGWAPDAQEPAARRTWKRFADLQAGDWLAIKGFGGESDLVVHFVGEVTAVDPDAGRVELRRLDRTLYKGKAPSGAMAGNYFDTLVPVRRADAIEKIFGVKDETAKPTSIPAPARKLDLPLNLILYGPPGTGKTFYLRDTLFPLFTRAPVERGRADAVAEVVSGLKWYEAIALALHAHGGRARVDGLVDHPVLKAKHAAQAIPTPLRQMVWGTLGQHTVESNTTVKMKRRLGELLFDKEPDGTWFLAAPLPESLTEVARQLAAPTVAVPASDYTFVTFHQAYGYEDFIEGIRPRVATADEDEAATLTYQLEDGVFNRAVRAALRLSGYDGTLDEFCRLPAEERRRRFERATPYALFIDEINRGNVARIFGELITLLEPDKRLGAPNELIVTLPYSGTRFGVPSNLYVVGTMNTADRSVEALDAALRRRFDFKEMAPSWSELEDIDMEGDIELDRMLKTINGRLEKLIDRDHAIGHAYFMELDDDPTLDALKRIFRNKILPLLQEYFFGDWGKIGLVLGKEFVWRPDVAGVQLADFDHPDRELLSERPTWEVVDVATLSNHAFRRIYEHVD